MTSSIRVHDPRAGGDFRMVLRGGTEFSAAAAGLFTIDTTAVDWSAVTHLVDRILAAQVGHGFVIVQPWQPGASRVRMLLQETFGDVDPVDAFVVAHFPSAEGAIVRVLELRSKAGGPQSGLWCTGVTKRRLTAQTGYVGSPLGIVLAEPDNIQGLVSFDEGGQTTLMTRVTPANDGPADDLIQQLTQQTGGARGH